MRLPSVALFVRCAALVATISIGFGCGGQSKFMEDVEWSEEDLDQGGTWRDSESLFGAEEGDADRYHYELRGVRHDVTMADGVEPTTRCACLDVVMGRAGDKVFRWTTGVPTISPKNMVIAIRTEGTKCGGDTRSERMRRPSIQAVDTRDSNTVVVIEELPFGRPQALGAIVPKPMPGGSLWVRPRTKRLPYARSLVAGTGCRVFTRPRTTDPKQWR